jgi:hypothetical protein
MSPVETVLRFMDAINQARRFAGQSVRGREKMRGGGQGYFADGKLPPENKWRTPDRTISRSTTSSRRPKTVTSRGFRRIRTMRISLCATLLSIAAWGQTGGCPENRSPLLILGSYHMSNPGLDSVNLQADDVLSANRQQEIADVVERLARFAPTKVAIEAPYRDGVVPGRYSKYLKREYTLGRNETEQLGFRAAQRANLPTIYPVDFPMYMSGLTPSEIEDVKPKEEAPAKSGPLSSEDKLLRKSSVREYLLHVNDASMVRKGQAQYMKMLLPDVSSPAIYARADLVTNWYKRNLRILTNLNRVTEVGKDRVLLVIGYGHLAILQQLAKDSDYFCVVEAAEYLK